MSISRLKKNASSFEQILDKVRNGKFNKEAFIGVFISLAKAMCADTSKDYLSSNSIYDQFVKKTVDQEFEQKTIFNYLEVDGENLNNLNISQRSKLIDAAYDECESEIITGVFKIFDERIDVSKELDDVWEDEDMDIREVI